MTTPSAGAAAPANFVIEPDGAAGAIVTVRGDVDIANAAAFESAVESALALSPDRVAFDLSQTGFIDSSGLAVLVAASVRGVAVSVRNASRVARRLIEVSGLADTLGLQP